MDNNSDHLANKEKLVSATVSSLGWEYINIFSMAFLQFIVLAVLARLLTPEDYGLVTVAMIFAGVMGLFSNLGVGPALIQKKEISIFDIRTGFTISVFVGLVMSLFLWILSPWVSVLFHNPEITKVLRYISITFVIAGIGTVSESLLLRYMQFKKLMMVNIVSYLFGYSFVAIILAVLKFGVWALVGAIIGQSLVKTFALLVFQPHSFFPRVSGKEAKGLLYFGSGLTLSSVLNYVASQGDYYVTGQVLGTAALGIYSRAYQLMALPAVYFGQALQKVTFPAMSKIQQELPQITKFYFMSASLIGIVVLPLSAYMYILAPEIVSTLLGPNWIDVIDPFKILAFGILFRTAYKIDHSLTKSMGAVYRRSLVDGFYALNVILFCLIGSRWGIVGISFGVLVAVFINYVLSVSLSLRLIEQSWSDFLHLYKPGIFLTAVVCLASISTKYFLYDIGVPDFLILVITFAVSLLAAGIVFVTFPRIVGKYGSLGIKIVIEALPKQIVPLFIKRWAQMRL